MKSLPKDEVFKEQMVAIADFKLGKKVASVFHDLLVRSVPFYEETQRVIAEMAADFVFKDTTVYDLGCSTGTMMLNLHPNVPPSTKFIGIDSAEDARA
ncbi:MAG: hypothetical protein ABIP71_13120 [Verrucomicrobiota bacterium]